MESITNNVEWKNVIILCSYAVNKRVPDSDAIHRINIERLYETAEKHLLTAAVGMALESAKIRDERFVQKVALAQRKNALLDADRAKVLAELEKAGIWYLPLKGVVLKDLYPRYGMRQMTDNDILIDPTRREDVRKIMEGLGFTTEKYEKSEHDAYHKKPVSSFEMHVYLINGRSNKPLETYYLNVKNRLIKDEGNQYGYHFSDEDFYLFMIAHEYKHYVHGGTGLRSLLDTYVYLKKKQDSMDWDYIRQEAEEMGIREFEEGNRNLALHLFDNEPLTETEEKMLDYIVRSGTYGTVENDINNQIQHKGHKGFFLSRLTPSKKDMLRAFPVLKRVPWLYPFCWIWRLIRGALFRRKKFWYQVKAALGLMKDKEKAIPPYYESSKY